jgi:tetratricopeptide (TPR) repeat protein
LRILLGRLHALSGDRSIAMGAIRGALVEYEASVTAFAALVEGDSAETRDLKVLAEAYGRLGRYHAERRRNEIAARPKPALDALERAGALWKRLAALEPDESAHLTGSAADQAMVGLVLHRAGRHAKALAALEASVKTTRDLLASQPKDGGLKHDLARRVSFAADVALEQGKLSDAARRYTEALQLMAKLPANEETNRTRERLQARLKRARAN